jgi:glycosyltransferase involved in cell wall biosynthesis
VRICLVHNAYRVTGGEDVVVGGLRRLLEHRGHEVFTFSRSSADLSRSRFGPVSALFKGIYRPGARRDAEDLLRGHRPDLFHVHNLYPLISPWILPEFRRSGVPVVMTVHNYRLVCPNGLLQTGGKICERCLGGREYWCFLKNCEESIPKSASYALRTFIARHFQLFLDNVSVYIALTRFQREKLVSQGFPPDRVAVIPQMIDEESVSLDPRTERPGKYVGYVGRISPEKGIDLLLRVARDCPEIPFRLAGDVSRMPEVLRQAPPNCAFLGILGRRELECFYQDARIVVLPTRCYEGFPLSIVEAMACGKPVICSRIGGLPEIVEDGVTGMLFNPGDGEGLRSAILRLWEDTATCARMGSAGREKASREYSAEAHYANLMDVYRMALHRPLPTATA